MSEMLDTKGRVSLVSLRGNSPLIGQPNEHCYTAASFAVASSFP
jgi:hypothetical protein